MTLTGAGAWVEKLGRKDMPVMASIIRELNQLTGSDDTEINQLASVILKDANLTSQVLRIANSVQFNPSSYPISTISRAIILIGFGGVRAICVSVLMIDRLLGQEPRERLLKQMAQSFHAAVQARNLVKSSSLDEQEEVFIAALLYHIGEMAFWASGGEAADKIEDTLKMDLTLSLRDATERVIGTSLKAISKGLAEIWNLGDTLLSALYPHTGSAQMVKAVVLGEEISRATLEGWDSLAVADVVNKVTVFTGTNHQDVRKLIMDSADEAAQVAVIYGAAKVCHLIPSTTAIASAKSVQEKPRAFQPNTSVQLNILRDLSNAVHESLDVNTVFQMVLEGMHRGIGLERVTLAFLQDGCVKAKYVLGQGTEAWRKQFIFSLQAEDETIFSHAIQKGQPVWFKKAELKSFSHLYTQAIKDVVGCIPSMLSVVKLGGRDVAIFYADRWCLGGEIDEEQFESFRHFNSQTQMCLQMLAQKRKQSS